MSYAALGAMAAGLAAKRLRVARKNSRRQARTWAGQRRVARLFVPPRYWAPRPMPLIPRGRRRRGRRVKGPWRSNPQAGGLSRIVTAPPVRLNVTTTRSAPVKQVIDTEQIQEIIYATGQQIQGEFTFSASSAVLPRLASTAKGYQKYRVNSLKFTYLPTVGTSTNGTVFMMHIANLDDEAYRVNFSPADFTPVRQAVRSSLSQASDLIVGGSMMIQQTNGFFVNSDDPLASSNRFFYFPGVFHWLMKDIGTNIPANSSVGRIECSYDVTLSEPKQVTDTDGFLFDSNTSYFPVSYGFRSSGGSIRFLNPRGFGIVLMSTGLDPPVLGIDGVDVACNISYQTTYSGATRLVSVWLITGDWLMHTITAHTFDRGFIFSQTHWSRFMPSNNSILTEGAKPAPTLHPLKVPVDPVSLSGQSLFFMEEEEA